MGSRAALPDVTYLAIMRSIARSISYYSLLELDISPWLTQNPLCAQITDFPPGWIPGLIIQRITHHVRRRIFLTAPSAQQINFETPAQSLGIRGLTLTVIVILLTLGGSFHPAFPCPNHYEHGRFTECETDDSVEIAILFHRLIAIRMEGRAPTGANFLFRIGLTFGVRLENIHVFPNDEMIVRMAKRLFLSDEDTLSDLRRYGHPLASLSNYASRAQVAFNGLGFHTVCSFREAIQMIAGVFLLSTRTRQPFTRLAILDGATLGFPPLSITDEMGEEADLDIEDG